MSQTLERQTSHFNRLGVHEARSNIKRTDGARVPGSQRRSSPELETVGKGADLEDDLKPGDGVVTFPKEEIQSDV